MSYELGRERRRGAIQIDQLLEGLLAVLGLAAVVFLIVYVSGGSQTLAGIFPNFLSLYSLTSWSPRTSTAKCLTDVGSPVL